MPPGCGAPAAALQPALACWRRSIAMPVAVLKLPHSRSPSPLASPPFETSSHEQDEHGKAAKSEEEVKSFDTDFTKVDQGVLFELILVRC